MTALLLPCTAQATPDFDQVWAILASDAAITQLVIRYCKRQVDPRACAVDDGNAYVDALDAIKRLQSPDKDLADRRIALELECAVAAGLPNEFDLRLFASCVQGIR